MKDCILLFLLFVPISCKENEKNEAVARQYRETGNWFIGGITDENEHIIFDF